MKANDLRIGNLVSIGKVTAIRSEDDFVINDEWGSLAINVEPIPLTDEWLLKFGFDLSDPVRPIIKEPDWFELECEKNDGLKEVYLKADEFTIGIPIKYVHQLQNIHFVITGTELKLNP